MNQIGKQSWFFCFCFFLPFDFVKSKYEKNVVIERIWWIQYICDYFFITTHELSHLFSQFDPWQTVLAIYLANFESNKTQTQKVIRIKAVKTHEISSDRQKRTIHYEICGLQKNWWEVSSIIWSFCIFSTLRCTDSYQFFTDCLWCI